LTALAGRVTTLEGKDTIVVSKPVSGSNFTEGIPNIVSPSTTADYLIQADDDKYYYWRYIDSTTGWQLISGAGGGGSGNTSGYDLTPAEYEALDGTYSENTDYYVSEADGVHHYRYIMVEDAESGEDVLTEIEIGRVISTSNIKKYNMARVDTTRVNSETNQEEDVSYLNLYEFDYGADNTIIDTESASMHLRAQIELPKGGGGTTSNAVNTLIRLGNQSI